MGKIIFDLDDTLYCSKELRLKRDKVIFDFLGPKINEYLLLKKSKGTIESFKEMGINKKEFFKIINKVPINVQEDKKLIDMLSEIGKRYELIVLSNNSEYSVGETLEKLGILHLIKNYYNGEYFENEKPHEECFFMVEKGDICVGNSFRKDLEIPKKLGAITILVSKNKHPESDFTISNIYELDSVLKSIENV